MNNYLKILNFLEPAAGTGGFINVHQFLENLGFSSDKDKQSILGELSKMEFVQFDGGRKGGTITVGSRDGSIQSFGKSYHKEYEAKITLTGLRYLKEEKQEFNTRSEAFSLVGNNNTVLYKSHDISIGSINHKAIVDTINKIQETLSNDHQIGATEKENGLIFFERVKDEVSHNRVGKTTVSEIIAICSNITSIASFGMALISLIMGKP